MINKASLSVLDAWAILVAFTLEKKPDGIKPDGNKGFAVLELFPLNGKTAGTVVPFFNGRNVKAGECIVFLQGTKTGKIRTASKTALL